MNSTTPTPHQSQSSTGTKAFISILVMMMLLFGFVLGAVAQNTAQYLFATAGTASLAADRNANVVDLTTSTQLVAASQDDISSGVNLIGFNFIFANTTYTQFSASSNGAVRLGATAMVNNSYGLSFPVASVPIIAPYWGDLATSSTGKVHFKLVGSAPNRALVVEFLNMKINYSSTTVDGTFQVRLYETTNIIEYVYGAMKVNGTTTTNSQKVAIGFASTTGANNQFSLNQSTYATNITATPTINANTATGTLTGLNSAANGSRRSFTFTPQTYLSQIISANPGSASWCAGETRNVTVTIKNTGTATWTDASPDINIGVKWNTNGSNWTDYYIRTDAGGLAPGATQTYTLPITASNNIGAGYTTPLAAGANNLIFDIVYEGSSWFGDNGGTGVAQVGPGNTKFTSAAQTIYDIPQGSLTGNSICTTGGTGQLTFTSTAGTGPFTVIYNDGIANRTANSVVSGTAFNAFTNPSSTTSYTLVSVTNAAAGNSCPRTSGFTGGTATITVNTPVSISAHPQPATQCVGQTATFSVTASGSSPTYQWRKNGSNISGATAASYTTPALIAGDNGATFDVVVTVSGCGSVTSNTALLTVNTPPSIGTQPSAQSKCTGSSVTFTVAATGTAPITYQWKKAGVAISGETNASYTIASVSTGDAASYTVDVTNICSTVASGAAALSVSTPANITTNPASQTVCVGATPAFSVAATGGPLTYQWRKNGANISGATAASYTSAAVVAGDNGSTFDVIVTAGPCGSVTSSAATLTVNTPPAITSQPATQTKCAADAVTFTVAATGTAPITYQWKKNGTNISGATSSSYTISNLTAADAASYTVTLTNICTNITSNAAVLTINPIPTSTGASICQNGASVNITASATCPDGSPVTLGPKLAGLGSNSGSGTAWTTPTNIYTDNNAYATVSGTGTAFSQALAATTFGFAIPANATIKGIQVGIARFRSGGISGEIQDNTVKLIKGGAGIGNNNGATSTDWPTGEALATYGTTTDLWGTTWSVAEVNASNFGVALVVDNTSTIFSRTANVDYIQISITYTIPGALNWYTVSSGGTAIGSGSSFNPVGVLNSGLPNTNAAGTTVFYAECSTIAGCRTPTNYVINALPSVSITGNAAICLGSGTTLSPTSGGTWVSNTPSVASVTNAGAVTSVAAGSSTFTFTSSTSPFCAATTSAVTVKALPTVSSVTGGTAYCIGQTPSNVQVAVTGAAPWSVSYTLDGVAQSAATGSSSPITLGNTAGVYVVTGVNDANCSNSASGTQTISFYALPTVTSVSGGGTYCANQTAGNVMAAVTGAGPWSVAYTLNGVSHAPATGSSSPINLGNATGVYVVTGVSDTHCSNSASGTQTITVNALPTVSSLTGGASYCVGQTPADIQAAVTGAGPWSVSYTLNGVAQTAATGTSSPISLGNATGVYVITGVSDANCSNSAGGTQTISFNALPTVTSVTGGAIYCAGQAVANIEAEVTGAGPWSVSYTLNGVAQTAATGSSSPVSLGNAAGVYLVTAVNDANCSNTASGTQTITINALPTVISVTGGASYCTGQTADDIQVAVTGAGPWSVSYTLDGVAQTAATGSSSPISLGNAAGMYAVTSVSDANCSNSASGTQTITINALPTVSSVTGGATYCAGQTVFNIEAAVTGAGPWSVSYTLDGVAQTAATGSSSPVSLGNAAGVYVVTGVSDANCSNTAGGTQTIIINSLPTVSSVSGGATYCAGQTVADIEVAVTGAGPWSVTYTLNGVAQTPATGSSSPISLGNAAGVYVVTNVSDANCSNTAGGSQTIIINSLPTVSSVSGGATYCAGQTVADIEATVTGSGPWSVSYTLDGVAQTAATGSSSPISLGNAAGVYVVTSISDANCSNSASGTQTITINALPTVTSVTGGGTYCAGQTVSNIEAAVTGAGPWSVSYTLDGVAQTPVSGSSSPVSLGNAAGVYVVTSVSDANCSNTASGTQTITINSLPTVSSVSGGGTYCAGQTISDIEAAVTGTGPWSVSYTLNGVAQTPATGSSSPITLGNAPGVYVVTSISDANCSNSASGTQTITINALPTVSSVSGGGTYCAGQIVSDIEVAVTGAGPWSVSYTLNGVAQTAATGSSSPISLGNAAGVYAVTSISDANCTNTANGTQTITINALPTVSSVTGGAAYCAGQTVSDIEVSVTGAGPWSVSYTLNGVAQTPVSGSSSPISLGNAAGVYVVTSISDANCSNTASGTQTITINALPTVTSVTGGASYCAGQTASNITVAVTGSGPWSVTYTLDGVAQTPATGSSSPISLGNANGVYVVTGISDANCSNSASGTQTISTTQNATIVLSSAAGTAAQSVCINNAIAGISYTIGGSGTGASLTGTLPNGVTGSLSGNIFTISGTPTQSGSFSYTVTTTGSPCINPSMSGTINVTAASSLSLTSAAGSNNQAVCNNSPITNITYQLGGSATSATVSGLPTGVTGSLSGSVFTISGTPVNPGTYSYSITATGSCAPATVTGSIKMNTPLSATYSKTNVSACGGNDDGSITAMPSGGTAPYTYSWTGNTGNGANTPYTAGNQATISNLKIGYYNVTITDAIGCTTSISGIHIAYAFTVYITNSGSMSASCANTGSILLYGNAGVQPYSYSLDGTNYQSSNTFNNLAAGNYTAYIKDAAGCANTKSITLTAAQPVTVSPFVRNPSSCSPDGSIEIYRNGGIPPYSYSLNNGPFQVSNVYSNLAAGSYTCIVKDSKGCTASSTTTLIQGTALSVTVTKSNSSTCVNDGGIQVYVSGGVAPFMYSKDGGATYQSSSLFTGLGATSYAVKVKDSKGCLGNINVTISLNPIVINNVSVVNASNCITPNGSIQLFRTGGVGPYTYSLDGNNYQTSNQFLGLAAGTYTGYVKDSKTCIGIKSNIVVGPSGCGQRTASTSKGPATAAQATNLKVAANSILKLSAYPNPTSASFRLMLEGKSGEKVSITVTDLVGRSIYHAEGSIDARYEFGQNFIAGVYMLQVTQGNQKQSLRLIKE